MGWRLADYKYYDRLKGDIKTAPTGAVSDCRQIGQTARYLVNSIKV